MQQRSWLYATAFLLDMFGLLLSERDLLLLEDEVFGVETWLRYKGIDNNDEKTTPIV